MPEAESSQGRVECTGAEAVGRVDEQAPLDPKSAGRNLFLLCISFALIYLGAGASQQYVMPYLKDTLGWTTTAAGLCLMAVYVGELFIRVPNLALVHSLPDSLLTVLGGVTYALFPAALAAAYFWGGFPLVLGVGLLWGWGAAAFWTGSSMQALRYGEAMRGRHGLGAGLLYFTLHIGFTAGVFLQGRLHATAGVPPWLPFALAAVATAVGVAVAAAIPPTVRRVSVKITWADVVQCWRRVKVRVAGFLMFTSGMALGTIFAPFAQHASAEYGPVVLYLTAVFFPLARLLVALISGALSDVVAPGWVLAVVFWATSAALAIVPFWKSAVALAIAAFCLGLLQGTVPPVATAIVGKSADRLRRPLPHAIIFSFRDLGASVAIGASIVASHVLKQFSLTFPIFAGLFALCGLASLLLVKHWAERL